MGFHEVDAGFEWQVAGVFVEAFDSGGVVFGAPGGGFDWGVVWFERDGVVDGGHGGWYSGRGREKAIGNGE